MGSPRASSVCPAGQQQEPGQDRSKLQGRLDLGPREVTGARWSLQLWDKSRSKELEGGHRQIVNEVKEEFPQSRYLWLFG